MGKLKEKKTYDPRTVITVAITSTNDNLYYRFIQFAIVYRSKLTFGRRSITGVFYRTVQGW
jgi:hypothetical protein